MMRFGPYIAILFLMVAGCRETETSKHQPDYASLELPSRPNIVWIVAEDLSAIIPPYGDSTVATPNISRLAEEGVLYTHFFSPSGVCAPSRAAIATGMYPTRIGAHHMRTGPWFRFTTTDKAIANYSRKAYEAMPPAGTHMMSSYLRRAGYFCTNNPKEDYQFRCELGAWDESNFEAHWKHRPTEEQPFFAIFNLDNTHESMIWRRANDTLLVDSLLEMPIPPYLPTTDIAKRDVRRLYSHIVAMDRRVGNILDELEAAGELENTIIFWYTDHGGPLPRQKRTIYDSGIHVPMIIRFPNQQLAGKVDSQLLSFIDLKPTALSLAGIEPPSCIDGKAWTGKFADLEERDYIFAAADRFDNETDKVRAVRGRRFKLVRYYNLDQPYYLPVKYRETMPIMQELLRLHDKDSLNEYQNQWFRPKKDSLELFDLWNDPHELHNIIDNPKFADKVAELRTALDNWIAETEDKGRWTEEEYLEKIWPGGEQPVTDTPAIQMVSDSIVLRCTTEGAQVGYQWAASGDSLTLNWTIYQSPISPQNGKTLFVQAHRIGYRPSSIHSRYFRNGIPKRSEVMYSETAKNNENPNERGIVYISKDNGKSWENRSNGIPDNVFLTDIAVSNNSLGIATKQHGIYLYDFTLQIWEPIKNNKPASSDIDAFFISEEKLYVGTQGEGVFITGNKGKEWRKINAGLGNLTIRKLLKIGNKLFAGTNGGLFSFDSKKNIWTKEYGDSTMQVNGIALYDDEVYIGTNHGAFKAFVNHTNWKSILPGCSLHNISVANGVIYAMAYNELFASKDKGESWYSDQSGLPDGMYSFQVIALGNEIFVGQWDGIYTKNLQENWVKWSNGLPAKIPITEMKIYSGILVAATSQWYSAD